MLTACYCKDQNILSTVLSKLSVVSLLASALTVHIMTMLVMSRHIDADCENYLDVDLALCSTTVSRSTSQSSNTRGMLMFWKA